MEKIKKTCQDRDIAEIAENLMENLVDGTEDQDS